VGSVLTRVWKTRNSYKMLGGKLEGRRPLGIPVFRCWDSMKIHLKIMV